jgi:drug/metabolite transporter (DMT)-like permease
LNLRSGVVFANAFVLSIETIFVESLIAVLQISPLTVAAITTPLAGGMLIFIVAVIIKDKITVFRIITWYDAVSKIGASKEATLTSPLEATMVLFLAWFFLKERLSKVQLIGAMIAIIGIFATAMSGRGTLEAFSSSVYLFTGGDLEAMLSAVAFAVAIIFLAKLVRFHSAIQVAGASLFVSGLILAGLQLGYYFAIPTVQEWDLLLLYSFLPLIGALLYSMSLRKVGASITSIIASSAYLMTIATQLALSALGFKTILPENIALLVVGGLLGLLGISLIYKDTIIVSFRRLSLEFEQGVVRRERRDE